MVSSHFLGLAGELESAGLIWRPEIGDEIADRDRREKVSILVDPLGLTPEELRSTFLWLPNVEQMVLQFEARQMVVRHIGLDIQPGEMFYRAVVESPLGEVQGAGASLRMAVGVALREVLLTGVAPIQ